MADGPLLVYGPRSPTYDFGPGHPLTPRRFGPGIDLLRSVGAAPGLAPEPAPDSDLLLVHTARYLRAVRRLSTDPFGQPEAGIGQGGDDPAFAGMHDAAASVADGSLRSVEAILRGDVEHAFHPGGGLHHAMADRASGFCIYDDPALAIALARRAGRRVLYLDFDVHHGDGVQAIHADDPGVMTVSLHESGRYLFPGTGFVNELGYGAAAGTIVNVPFEPGTGEGPWWTAVESLVPALAAAFGPDLVVSQHGADGHAWDPLAHLRLTTTAMGRAARLVDAVAHRYAGGAWLSTGGGGYDAYRVVPRSWSLVWLAGAHRDPPDATPAAWRERWANEAARYGQAPLPATFLDDANAGEPRDAEQERAEIRSTATAALVRQLVVPTLLREAEDRGWWSALEELRAGRSAQPGASVPPVGSPAIRLLTAAEFERMTLADRVLPIADSASARRVVGAALRLGARVPAAVHEAVVGLAIVAPDGPGAAAWNLVGLGVAPEFRREGVARALLAAAADAVGDAPLTASVGVADRDPIDPLPVELRASIARRLLEGAGFRVASTPGDVGRADGSAIAARRG